jgi:HK97 gp10 family phage protein
VNDFSQVNRLAFDIGKVTAEAQVLASKAVRKTLFDIEADAKQLAPVDTGNLRNSISTEVNRGGLGGEVGPTAEYGIYQEYGTSTQSGTPYMGPAFDRRAPALEAMLGRLADGLR